jgi:hypothetical protein
MPRNVTPEGLAERICQRLELPTTENVEVVAELLRDALRDVKDATVATTKAACLVISEEEAERCRSVGATAAQQTALMIAARIRKRHVET